MAEGKCGDLCRGQFALAPLFCQTEKLLAESRAIENNHVEDRKMEWLGASVTPAERLSSYVLRK